MKVTTKFFVVALILSLIFAVSAVAAAEDISFDQSDSEEVLQETDMELDQGQDNIDDKLSVSEADDDLNSPTEEENQLSSGSNTVTGENFTDIQTVIDSAIAGETIFLDGKTYKGSSLITVDKGLIIDGGSDSNGDLIATLDAQELSMILYVTASNVVIKNINFINGKTSSGGAIYCSGANGIIENCNFTNNKATGDYSYGGAVYFRNTGNVTNCNFTNNTATRFGGAIYFDILGVVENCNFIDNQATGSNAWGGAVNSENTLTLTNCNFTNNSASNGGAVCSFSGKTINCNFINNKATNGNGGAVRTRKNNVENCKFTNNTATGNGGAVYFYENGGVINCDFTNNKATSGGGGAIDFIDYQNLGSSVMNCNLTNNSALEGGAIRMNLGSITNCNFTGNNATNGGAIYFVNNSNVINCNFTNNTASNRGGAIYFFETGTVTNCNFTNNQARYGGGAVYFNSEGNVTNCNFADNKATGANSQGGAIYMGSGSVTNCNFTNNQAIYGGAIRFYSDGTVTNCNFTNNQARYGGGAVYFSSSGTVTNCNFTNNQATENGGAIRMSYGSVTNCNFTNNQATYEGGAVYFYGSGTVTNCNFADNSANQGGAIFSQQWYTTADTCIFKANSGENFNVVTFAPSLNVDNFTTFYGSGEKLTFDLKTNSSIPVTNGNISISVYFKDNNNWVRNYTCLSGEGWIPDLPVGSYYAIFDTEYEKFQPINRTIKVIPDIKYYVNVTSLTTNNKTVNITAKSNIPQDILEGKLLFIVPNSDPINATYAGNGTWWAVHTFADYGDYKINATYIGLDNVTVTNATVSVEKIKTHIAADEITATYNTNMNLVITLKDSQGKALSGFKVTVDLNGAKTYTTDANGQIKIQTKGLTPKTYTAKITFNGDNAYDKTSKDVKVTVKKATPKIIAKKKTFKAKKTKKFTITLKDNNGKPIKNAKVRLIVKKIVKKTKKTKTKTKKKYKKNIKKTNKKGKATFNVKRNKKGKYQAIIKYYGNKYFKAISKKVKITIK